MCAKVPHLGDKDHHQADWGVKQIVKSHRWNEWRQSEPRHDMLHMNDRMRVKMGRQVVRYFEGEHERHGIINYG